MSELVATLLETARADTDLLISNDRLGDVASIVRRVDFLLIAPDKKRAELIANFINDNRYGEAMAHSSAENHRVVVALTMPLTQNVLCSVSALMECMAAIFGLVYDGWESNICRATVS